MKWKKIIDCEEYAWAWEKRLILKGKGFKRVLGGVSDVVSIFVVLIKIIIKTRLKTNANIEIPIKPLKQTQNPKNQKRKKEP